MKLFNINKGEFGYINKKKVYEGIKTVIMFAVPLIIYFVSLYHFKTNKNLFTIIAVLLFLPAAKSCVSFIMFLRFKSLTVDLYEKVNRNSQVVKIIYELIFTTEESAYLVKALGITNKTIVLLTDIKDDKKKNKLKNHLESCLIKDYIEDCSLKIYSDEEAFIKRLNEMNENFNEDDSYIPVFNLFKAISL